MKACKKTIAVILCLFLVDLGGISQDLYAANGNLSAGVLPSGNEQKGFTSSSFINPILERYAHLEEFTPSTQQNGPFIIHIRDLHCHDEAQMKIAQTLEELWRRNSMGDLLVLTEGAEGFVDTRIFGSFPDSMTRKEASKSFLNLGKITGPEYLSITKYRELPIRIEGVEDSDLYLESFMTFRNVIGRKQETDAFLKMVDDALDQIKKKIFSKDLLELDQKEKQYYEGSIAFEEYAKYLYRVYDGYEISNIDRKGEVPRTSEGFWQGYPNFSLLAEVLKRQEGISVEKVEEERNRVIEALSQKLTKEELARLIKGGIEYRIGKVTLKDYFEELRKFSLRYLISSESSIEAEYPNLAAYIELVGLQATIDHQALFDETSEITKKIKENSSRTPEEKEVLDFAKKCEILKRMLNLEITREDHSFYSLRKNAYQVQTIEKELNELLLKHKLLLPGDLSEKAGKVIQVFIDGEKFYELALKRDRIMVEKTLEKLKAEDKKNPVTVVLITGGFHTKGVTQLLRKNNVGYAIMTPRVIGKSDMANYRNLMMDERISTKTISFFSLFNQKLASRFPEMRQQELMGLADDLIQLSNERKVDRTLLQAWIEELDSQNTGDPDVKNLAIHFKARLEGEPIQLKGESPRISPEIIHQLMSDYSLLTAELTAEVLKELGEKDLLKHALDELEKRRAIEAAKARESGGFGARSLTQEVKTPDAFSSSDITQKHIGSSAVNIDAMQAEVARVEFRKPSLLEMREANILRTVVKEWLKQSLDQELGKIGLNTSLIGWDALSQVLDALSRGLNKVKVRYNNQDYQVEVKLAQSELAVPNVHAMTHRDGNVIQIVISKGHLDALPHELIETLLLTRPENRSPPKDQKRLREHAVHTKVVLLESLFDPTLDVQDRKIDGKVKGRISRELKDQMPASLSKLIAGSVQASRDIDAKQGIKALDAQSAELAKDLARHIVFFATQRLKRLKNDDLHLLGESHGKIVWIERQIMARFTDFGFLKEEEFGSYLKAILESELRRLSFKRDEIVITLRSSSFSSPLRQLFEPRNDMKPSVRKQLLRRALKYEMSSLSFHHERSVLKEKAVLGQIKDAQEKILSEQQIGDLPDSEVIFLVQPYLGQVEERFLKEDTDFTFQLQSEELMEEAIFNLLKRKDLSNRVGPQNHEAWGKYISEKLSTHEKDIQLNFLQALATYLNNDIPEAGLLRSLPIELLFELTRLTVRYDLWNDESIEALAGYAEEAINRIKLETGKPPVMIELSSGYGDLSLGLSQRFPEIRVIPTNSMSYDNSNQTDGPSNFYDPNIIAQRGVQTLMIEEILSGEFRKELHIPEDVGVILVASHLPLEKGMERALLNQTHAQELIFIHSRRVGMKDRVSGDAEILPNREIWDFDFSYLDPEVWFNSIIYRGRRDDLELYALSRKPYQVGVANGAVQIQNTEDLLKSDKVSAMDFLNWLYSHIGWNLTFESIKTIFEKTSLSPKEYQGFLKILDHMVQRSTDSEKKDVALQTKVYFEKLRPFEIDLDQEIEKLMNLIQTKTEKAFERSLLVQDEKNIREMIQMVRDVHKNQARKDGKTPYFKHQLEVTRTLVETFGVIDPLAIQIALLHDTREDQEELYSEIRVKLYEDVLKKIRDQDSVNLMRLGVRMLSKLEGEKFAGFTPEEAEKEYFRRLVHPKSVYSKDQDPRYQDVPWYSGYDNDFIHRVQLIKLADRIANISDMENLFREDMEISEKMKAFPEKVFNKTLNAFIPMFVLNKESQFTPEERSIFLEAFKTKLDQYIKGDSQRLEFLRSAAQEARKRLEQMLDSMRLGAVSAGQMDLAGGKVKGNEISIGKRVDRPVSLDQIADEIVSKFLAEEVTLEELDQYVDALKSRRYLDARVTKVVGISQRLMNKHRLLRSETLDVLLRVQKKITQIRRETPTVPVPRDKAKEDLPPTVRPKSVQDEKPFDYVSRSVRRFMPLEDVGEKTLPGSVSRLLVTPMLARTQARAKVIDFLRSYIGVRRDWEVAVLDKILMMRNFAHVISSVVSDPTVYQIGLGTGFEKSRDRLNLITPLLETDFTRLIAVEENSLSFNEFKERVTSQLKDVVDENTAIEFPKDEQRDKDQRFVVRFTYGQKLRTVVAYFNFDGMEKYPSEIEKGYDVLIRGTAIGEPKFYEKLFELLRDGSGFILAYANDLTTVDQKEYSDRENMAFLNTVNFGYPLKEFPYFLKNFTEVTSQPFYDLARNVSRQERILENGFMESRPVLLAKNNTVKTLKMLQSETMSQSKESLTTVPSSEVTTEGPLSDSIAKGLSINGDPSLTQTLTEESRQRDEVEEVIPIKLGINLFSLKINYPAILRPLSLKGRDLVAESDPHIELVDKESFVKLIKNLFELKTDLEAEMRSRQFLVKAFQGIVLTTKRTGDYRIINKNDEWSVVEVVNVANAEELYQRLEKILKGKLGRDITIPRIPASIMLYRSQGKSDVVANSEDPEIDMEPTDEERELIVKAIEARKPTSFVRTRKAEPEGGGSISGATSFSGVFKVTGVEASQAASSDQDPSPDGGSIGQWQVTSFEGPQGGHVMVALKGFGKNSDQSVENHKMIVTPLATSPALRAYIMNLRFMLSRIKPIGITQITLITHIQNIIDHFEERVNSGEVYLIEGDEYLGGYGGKEGIFISREMFETADALIALFHEAGESYFAEKENRWKVSKYLNPHMFLRGLGKGARERKRELTETEKALPFWDGKKVGLQDILFGYARNTLNFGTRGLEGQGDKTPDISVMDSAVSEIEGGHSGWFRLEHASDDILWRWRKIKNVDDLKILVKAEAVSLGQIGGQSIWVDRQLLKQYEAVGFLKLEDFAQSLKDILTEQFRLFPPSKETSEIVIALLTDSKDIVENHHGEGFIGINLQLFSHLGLSAKLRKKIFKMSLAHGLIHQHGIGNSEEEESLILEEDMRYAVQLGISTLDLKKSEFFNYASTSFLVKKLQQEYARVILDKTNELKKSLEKDLNHSIPFLLQILSNSNSEVEAMKVVKILLEKALKHLHEGRNGNGSSSELLRVEQALAPSRTTPLIPRVPTLESFSEYDVARLLKTDHEYGDFYKWAGILGIETTGMEEKVKWKETLVEPSFEMERMRFEFLNKVLEAALERVEAHLRGEKIQFPAQTSGIMTRGSKVRKIGGNFAGGSLSPTLFDKEVWIEAGSFAYKLWIEMSSYDDERSKLENEKHALINLQRHDRKYGTPVDLVYHPLIGQDYSVGHRSDNDYSVADTALGKSHFSVKVTENEFGLFLLEVVDNHSELGTSVDWRPPQESVSTHQKPTPFVGPIAEPSIEIIEPEEGDINIADMGLDAPEHGKVNEVIRQAAAEGRLKELGIIVNGKKVFLVQGVSTLYGKQIAHAGIELNSIYIAEQSFNPRLVRHEAIELQLWQEKVLELVGMDKDTDWESLDSKIRKNLKLKLRGWMRENSAEARKLEAEFHATANRRALIPVSEEVSTKSTKEGKVQQPFARAKSQEDLPVVLQSVRAHVRVFAQDFSNPSELLPKVSQYLEETVLPTLPPTDRPRAIEAAVGELYQVIGGLHPLPGILGIRESLIPQNLKDKIIDGLARKGYSEEELKSIWLQLDDMVGPAWIDLEGKVKGSLTWIRLVVEMMEEAGLLKTNNHAKNVERMSQAILFHQYAHQVIRPSLSEDDKSQLKIQLSHFLDKFGERFGSKDIEEVLAQFASTQFTDENTDLFEEVALDLESFLSGEAFPVIRLPRDRGMRQEISNEIKSTQPGLLEGYSGDMKLLFIDYRNSLVRKAGAVRFNDRVKGVLDKHLEFRREDPDLKMKMGPSNVWDLFAEGTEDRGEHLVEISDQVHMEIKDGDAKDINGKVIGMLVKCGSGVLQAWDRIVEKEILEFKGVRKGPRIYVLTVEQEGELTGLKEAYEQMKQTDFRAQLVINTALSKEKVIKWLQVQNIPESLLGIKIHPMDLTKERTIRSIYNRVGYLVKGQFDIEQDLILVVPDHPEERFLDFRPYEFKIVVGKLGQKTFLAPDVMGLALVLGSVDWAYRNQQMNPELKDKLKNFFLEVVKEYFENEEEQEKEIKKILVEIETYGFFKIPAWKNDLNDMMRRFVIQETYIATAA